MSKHKAIITFALCCGLLAAPTLAFSASPDCDPPLKAERDKAVDRQLTAAAAAIAGTNPDSSILSKLEECLGGLNANFFGGVPSVGLEHLLGAVCMVAQSKIDEQLNKYTSQLSSSALGDYAQIGRGSTGIKLNDNSAQLSQKLLNLGKSNMPDF